MPSSPLGSTNGRTMLGMACHHSPWTTNTVEQHRAWHVITAFGQHTWSNDIRRDMPLLPFDSAHGRTTSGLACHHRVWAAHTVQRHRQACHHHLWVAQMVERRRAWQDIHALGLHAWSDDVGCGMTSPPLDSTHGRTTSSVACHNCVWAAHPVEQCRAWNAIAFGRHTRSNDVRRGMPASPLGSTHDRMMSGVS